MMDQLEPRIIDERKAEVESKRSKVEEAQAQKPAEGGDDVMELSEDEIKRRDQKWSADCPSRCVSPEARDEFRRRSCPTQMILKKCVSQVVIPRRETLFQLSVVVRFDILRKPVMVLGAKTDE